MDVIQDQAATQIRPEDRRQIAANVQALEEDPGLITRMVRQNWISDDNFTKNFRVALNFIILASQFCIRWQLLSTIEGCRNLPKNQERRRLARRTDDCVLHLV